MRHICAVLLFAASLYGQASAGGKWTVDSVKDRMTDAPSDVFILEADSPVQDGPITATPDLSIFCDHGRLHKAMFDAGVVIGGESHESGKLSVENLLGVAPHQQSIEVRLDQKLEWMEWDTMGLEALAIGKHDLEKILKAKDFRISFLTYPEGSQVARFQPAGLDRVRLNRSCGTKFAPEEPTGGQTPALSQTVTQSLIENSKAAKSSPAQAAAMANVGHEQTPQELAQLVQNGQASRCAVVTSPPGAEVYVDGNKLGVSPVAFVLLRMGEAPRTITIKLVGYKTVEKTFIPDGKTIPIGLTLEKDSR